MSNRPVRVRTLGGVEGRRSPRLLSDLLLVAGTMERAILHVDMDAFFAAVEQRDHPEWRGKPVIVGSPPDKRGVVSTCSYEARVYGVHSAMPSRMAYEKCPQGVFVKPRMARYQEVSEAIFKIFGDFTPLVEGLSVDEAFLDVSGVRRLFGTPEAIAQQIKTRIRTELGLTCSIGVAHNKFLAKLASEERKPDGLFVVPREAHALLAWLGAKSVRALWGVGPALAGTLEAYGLCTVRDLQSVDPAQLRRITTPLQAEHLLAIAFGRDSRPVTVEHEDKSFSREHTYPEDILDKEALRRELRHIAEDVGRRLREAHLWSKTGRLKIRYAGFRTVTRQAPFAVPVCDDIALRAMAWDLLERHLEPETPVRLIGFGADNLTDSPATLDEDDLFAQLPSAAHPRERQERLAHTLDTLRSRFPGALR